MQRQKLRQIGFYWPASAKKLAKNADAKKVELPGPYPLQTSKIHQKKYSLLDITALFFTKQRQRKISYHFKTEKVQNTKHSQIFDRFVV